MKVKHWIMIIFCVVGLLYVAHILTAHGGVSGLKSGLGMGQ